MDGIKLNDKKVINGWAFFDWANSVYFLVISTAVFPIYYLSITEDTVNILGITLSNSALYSYVVSSSYIIIALLSPILSGMADYSGRKKFFLKAFTWLGSLACMTLFFFSSSSLIGLGTLGFAFATIGAAGGIVFYNAYLPEIATEDNYDQVSAKGFAYGYIGSVILLLFCLIMIQKPEWFGITSSTLPSRIAFALVGFWWIGFAQITFRRLPKDQPIMASSTQWVKRGFQEFLSVWHIIKRESTIIRFLIAFFFYSAGVQTVIYLASIFASKELNFETSQLIMTILIIQIVAVLGAYYFAYLSKIKGNKFSLVTQLIIWIIICIGAFFVVQSIHFYLIAGLVGLVLGGIQSLSRSTYAKLLEGQTTDTTSYFSFYDVLFKVSIVAGAFFFGLAEQITGNMRNSVLILGIFFVIGLIILTTITIQPNFKRK